MYFIYVDESGDAGLQNSPSQYFCLSGFVVHEMRWHETLEAIIHFRQYLRKKYGLKLREEIHAAGYIHKPRELARIPKSMRLRILRDTIDFQASLVEVSIINVVVDKSNKTSEADIFDMVWQTLIQRFHNTLSHKNFPGPNNIDDRGMLIVDQTDEKKLRNLSRRMRRYNPIPSAYGGSAIAHPTITIVEDPVHRNSSHSYFIQLSDVNAYFLSQKYKPCGYVQRKGGKNYIARLEPVLCTVASRNNQLGIIER